MLKKKNERTLVATNRVGRMEQSSVGRGRKSRSDHDAPPVILKPRLAAWREIVRQVEQGASAQEARVRSVVPMHRVTVYRLLKRVQREGERALTDGRHGHAVKLRGEALT